MFDLDRVVLVNLFDFREGVLSCLVEVDLGLVNARALRIAIDLLIELGGLIGVVCDVDDVGDVDFSSDV